MMLPGSNRRIHSVHRHSRMGVAGLAADGRQIVARAKSEAHNFESTYGEPIPVKELVERVASYVHLCTLYWWLRCSVCDADHFDMGSFLEVMIVMVHNYTWSSGVSYGEDISVGVVREVKEETGVSVKLLFWSATSSLSCTQKAFS